MKRADEAVEKVMSGLRAAEAASGLEKRVQDGLRRRMAERDAVSRRFGTLVGWRWLALGCGCAALVLVVARSMPRADRRVVTMTAGKAIGRPAPGTFETGRMSVDRVDGSIGSVPQRLSPRSGRRGDGTAVAVPLHSAGSLDFSSEATSNTTSFPAPPMPLTQQERLLLLIANHSGPEEVAMLDWSGDPAQDAEETAGFQAFFGRPESVEQTMQKDNRGENR